jgi:hypothetical protein
VLVILNTSGKSRSATKKNTEALLEASKDDGQEANTKSAKCTYMVISHHQNAGQSLNLITATESFEEMAKFRHSGMTLTNQNCIHEA